MVHKPSSVIHIDKKRISLSDPVYFIAEIGSNFDRDLSRAKDLIHLAKESGADAVKFQHYSAETLVSDEGFNQLGRRQSHQALWKKSVFDTYQDASLNRDWTSVLKTTCDEAGITFFTSPYSLDLVDYVDPFISAYKVGSGDITWPEIITRMASKGKPVLLATGASDMLDVQRAVNETLKLTPDLILLQCNTNYTVNPENFSCLQLNVLREYEAQYPGVVLGLSDHTPGHVAVLGAVALGARVIEKHFTDSIDREGPDHPFSMTPMSWREMVDRTRELEAALGDGQKKVESNELDTVIAQRRCIRAVRDLKVNSELDYDDLTVLRPCPPDGIAPYELRNLKGKKLKRCIKSGEHVKWEDLI
ncbi:N-acetylneuraminate synthase family protein [Desulfoluna butyratoxydans]|uniref:N-acetylneuraminic acid synthase n-terminal n=1 Tax=Desulfoluna butyratoxydans TaxID=231438 RepID=A0A4U8YPI5_9BACT|nr:N-acetylneuraminate synthase family protein [Desulfoluna butyratoxydans]VFQ46145.1 n-acetylneuraminic acid synthase n-terminal [Desulfoluna butyratoxydans]